MFFSKELQLALMGYSSVTTVILIILFVYIYLLKRSLNYKMCRSVSVESIKTLNRRSINNKYEVDSFTPQNTADIAKNRQSSMSVYDSAACGSVRVNLRCEETEKLTNEYEAIDENIKCTKGHQYERILESVATTLSTLYTSDKDEQDDIYDKFMVALKHRIWSKNPRLYKCLSKHHYETVLEKDKSCEDGDSTYHSFVVVQDRKSDNDNKSISTFGSSDHLKFLIESRSNENLIDTDSNYLQAKRFSARSNCPELLKELCSQQNINVQQKPNHQNSQCDKNESSKDVKNEVANPSKDQSKDSAHRSVSFADRKNMVDKTIKKPLVPPKKRTLSESGHRVKGVF